MLRLTFSCELNLTVSREMYFCVEQGNFAFEVRLMVLNMDEYLLVDFSMRHLRHSVDSLLTRLFGLEVEVKLE